MTDEQLDQLDALLDADWLCLCGDVEPFLSGLRLLLQGVAESQGEAQRRMLSWRNPPDRMCWLYMLDGLRLVDHGVSVSAGCWLSEKGKAVLQLLNNCDLAEGDE